MVSGLDHRLTGNLGEWKEVGPGDCTGAAEGGVGAQTRALHSREAGEEKQGHILLASQLLLLLSRSCCHSGQKFWLEQFHV